MTDRSERIKNLPKRCVSVNLSPDSDIEVDVQIRNWLDKVEDGVRKELSKPGVMEDLMVKMRDEIFFKPIEDDDQ